jgi:hypothetical protein
MDAHSECNEGWLEPLLYEIQKDWRTIAVPIIDILTEDDKLAYVAVDPWRGGVTIPDWVFGWIPAKGLLNTQQFEILINIFFFFFFFRK